MEPDALLVAHSGNCLLSFHESIFAYVRSLFVL